MKICSAVVNILLVSHLIIFHDYLITQNGNNICYNEHVMILFSHKYDICRMSSEWVNGENDTGGKWPFRHDSCHPIPKILRK